MKQIIKIMAITIALMVLLMGDISCSSSNMFTPEIVKAGVSYSIDKFVPQAVEKSIEKGGKKSYVAWQIVEQATREVLLPAISGDTIKITEINKWIDLIYSNNKISQEQSDVIQIVLNMVLKYVPTQALDDLLKSNKTLGDIQNVLIAAFEHFYIAIKGVLEKYSIVIQVDTEHKDGPVVVAMKTKLNFSPTE